MQPKPHILLTGMGGVGKSTLATKLAYDLKDQYPDGILWANLRHVIGPTGLNRTVLHSVMVGLLQPFGTSTEGDHDPDATAVILRQTLANKRALIILDNLNSAEELSYFLPPSISPCGVIVTSRNAGLAHEKIEPIEVPPFSVEACRYYFQKSLSKEQIGAESNLDKLAEIVGRLPLALKIIAGELSTSPEMTAENYIELLEEESKLEILQVWDDQTKNIRSSFELSFRKLTSDQQRLFAIFSLFKSGNFSLDAVVETLDMPRAKIIRDIAFLRSRSLIDRAYAGDFGEIRYQLHPLLHDFSGEKWDEIIDNPQTMTLALLEYFYQTIAKIQLNQFSEIDQEWENIHSLIEWGMGQAEAEKFSELVQLLSSFGSGMLGYLDSRSHWRLAIGWLEGILADINRSEEMEKVAATLIKLGRFNSRLTQNSLARRQLLEGLDLVESMPTNQENAILYAYGSEEMAELTRFEDQEEALAWLDKASNGLTNFESNRVESELAYLYIRQGTIFTRVLNDFDLGRAYLEKGLNLLGDQPLPAKISAYMTLGGISYFQGDFDKARQVWQEGVQLAELLGDKRRLGGLRKNLSVLESHAGYFHRAIEEHLKLLEFHAEDVEMEAEILSNLGEDYTLIGEFDEAFKNLQQAKHLAKQYDLLDVAIQTDLNFVQFFLEKEELLKAEELLKSVHGRIFNNRMSNKMGEALLLEARLAIQKEELELAGAKLDEARTFLEDDFHKGFVLRLTGQIGYLGRDTVGAEQNYQESLTYFESKQEHFEVARTHFLFGRLFLAADELSKSRESLQKANNIFQTLGLAYHVDQVGEIVNRL